MKRALLCLVAAISFVLWPVPAYYLGVWLSGWKDPGPEVVNGWGVDALDVAFWHVLVVIAIGWLGILVAAALVYRKLVAAENETIQLESA